MTAEFGPTDAPPGSAEKVELLRRRRELGMPLWHPNDRADFGGLIGAVQPLAESDELDTRLLYERSFPRKRSERITS
jgi:hypothetical protein